MMSRMRTTVAFFTLLICCGMSRGGEDAERSKKIEQLREILINAKHDAETADAFKKLFLYVGRAGLADLTKDENTSIALQAAWELNKQIVKRDPEIPGRIDWVIEPKGMEKFLTLMAERTNTEIPKWWREAVLAADAFPGEHHAFIAVENTFKQRAFAGSSKFATIEGKENQTQCKLGKTTLPHSDEPGFNDSYFGLLGDDRSFGVSYSDVGYPFKLSAYESKSGDLKWTAQVWAARRGPFGGKGFHRVELVRLDDKVFVFGVESHGAYMEAFDTDTGLCLYRFCSCYWFNFSEAWGMK